LRRWVLFLFYDSEKKMGKARCLAARRSANRKIMITHATHTTKCLLAKIDTTNKSRIDSRKKSVILFCCRFLFLFLFFLISPLSCLSCSFAWDRRWGNHTRVRFLSVVGSVKDLFASRVVTPCFYFLSGVSCDSSFPEQCEKRNVSRMNVSNAEKTQKNQTHNQETAKIIFALS